MENTRSLKQEASYQEMGYRLRNWEWVKNRVFPVLFPEEEKLPELFVSRPYLDLRLYIHIRLPDLGGNARVSKAMLAVWGVTEEKVYCQAMENMRRDDKYCIIDMEILLKEMGEIVNLLWPELDEKGPHMAVLLNQGRMYSAAGLLNTSLLAHYAEERKHNLFLLPSSVHEVIIVEDDGVLCSQELKGMVCEINRNEKLLSPEEKLSDHIYYFDRKLRRVSIVA